MFCPHCHNKIPDGSNFCPLCYANLVGVKQQEKESAAETDAPRPKQKPAPRKNNAKPAYTKGSRQGKRAQDKTPMIIAIGLILILVLIIVMIVRSMFGAGTPTVVNTPVPQATQQPQQENNFIVFGATNTPAPQLTATPNIEITPTPAPQAPAVTTYKTLRKGDRGQDVVSHAAGADFAGLPQGRERRQLRHGHQDGRLKTSRRKTGWTWTASRARRRSKSSTPVSGVTPIPDVTVAPGDILDLPAKREITKEAVKRELYSPFLSKRSIRTDMKKHLLHLYFFC